MIKAYAVGVMCVEYEKPWVKQGSRLLSLYAKLEDAEKAIVHNHGDMFEHYYNYALIEEYYLINPLIPGPSFYNGEQWWYYADYSQGDRDHPHITKTDVPIWAKNTCNFWIG